MLSKLLYVLLLSTSTATWAQAMPARWNELMKLVRTEVEMLEKANKKGDEVHYRLLELYSERLKLVLERENKSFMDAKDAKKHNTKEAYFTESLRQYMVVRNFGEELLKKYPDSKRPCTTHWPSTHVTLVVISVQKVIY